MSDHCAVPTAGLIDNLGHPVDVHLDWISHCDPPKPLESAGSGDQTVLLNGLGWCIVPIGPGWCGGCSIQEEALT